MKRIILTILGVLCFGFIYSQDDCNSAVIITNGATTTVGTINGDFNNTCGLSGPTGPRDGEWYQYTATGNGSINITSNLPQNDGITNSNDTRLSVSTGTCGGLTCYAAGDDFNNANFLTDITFESTNGTTYFFMWDERWSNLGFDFILTETVESCSPSIPFSDSCNHASFYVCWNTIDDDGDGFNWFVTDYDLDSNNVADGNPCFGSASYDTNGDSPLTPDNWLISSAIDLTGVTVSETIELSWKARGIDVDFADENYTIYVATGDLIANFLASPVSFNEIIGQNGGAGNTFVSRSLDISSFAGQTVFIAFRHHITSDQFVLNIDDIAVNAFTLGVNDNNLNKFNNFYNKDIDTLHLESSSLPISSVRIFNLVGQEVLVKNLSGLKEEIDLSGVSNGLYVVKIKIGNGSKVLKLLKE